MKKILKMANALNEKAKMSNFFFQIPEYLLTGIWGGKKMYEHVLHTHLLFDELLNYPVPQDKICHHRCWLIDYIFTINTTTFWFIVNVKYVTTCFDQSFLLSSVQ